MLGARFIAPLALIGLRSIFPAAEAGDELRVKVGVSVKEHGPKSQIVGGQPAKPGQFPWQVSLRDSYDEHTCGGSIISERFVLTADYCTASSRIMTGTVLRD